MASLDRQILRWSTLTQPILSTLLCPLCKVTNSIKDFKTLEANDMFNAGVIKRYQCPNCDLIFGDLRFLSLTEEEVKADYEDTYSYFAEGNTVPYISAALASSEICRNKDLTYLDWACGIGSMIPVLTSQGYNITGYDKYVKAPNVLNELDDLTFDVIYANNFIEHVLDPIKDIKLMLNHLKKGGYLIFISDCMDEYKVEITHFHSYYYVGRSLNLLINELGLKFVEIKSVGPCRMLTLHN